MPSEYKDLKNLLVKKLSMIDVKRQGEREKVR